MALFGHKLFTKVIRLNEAIIEWVLIQYGGTVTHTQSTGRTPCEDEGRDKDDVSTRQETPECQQTPTAGGEA